MGFLKLDFGNDTHDIAREQCSKRVAGIKIALAELIDDELGRVATKLDRREKHLRREHADARADAIYAEMEAAQGTLFKARNEISTILSNMFAPLDELEPQLDQPVKLVRRVRLRL
jgi:hypothetical protein